MTAGQTFLSFIVVLHVAKLGGCPREYTTRRGILEKFASYLIVSSNGQSFTLVIRQGIGDVFNFENQVLRSCAPRRRTFRVLRHRTSSSIRYVNSFIYTICFGKSVRVQFYLCSLVSCRAKKFFLIVEENRKGRIDWNPVIEA